MPAGIGDPVAAVERANSLVIVVLAGLLKRKRSIAAALMYITFASFTAAVDRDLGCVAAGHCHRRPGEGRAGLTLW